MVQYGMTWDDMAWHIMAWKNLSWHLISWHDMKWCHVMLWQKLGLLSVCKQDSSFTYSYHVIDVTGPFHSPRRVDLLKTRKDMKFLIETVAMSNMCSAWTFVLLNSWCMNCVLNKNISSYSFSLGLNKLEYWIWASYVTSKWSKNVWWGLWVVVVKAYFSVKLSSSWTI